ncbi:MAG: hypothetical protein HOL05_13240, partial [Nitrospinaceae bacterium]|nr:hypothetical protein [Nitrospinaceae bacterium]
MNFPTKFEDYAREIIEKLDNPQPDIEQENEGEELWPWPDLDDGFQITTLSEEEYEKEDSPFSDDESQDIVRGINGDGEFAGRGTDFLAFYKSLHFEEMPPFSGKWGIFVFDFGIKYLRDKILNFEPGTFSKAEGAQLAEDFLVRHEQFHFRFDAWVISHEAV